MEVLYVNVSPNEQLVLVLGVRDRVVCFYSPSCKTHWGFEDSLKHASIATHDISFLFCFPVPN